MAADLRAVLELIPDAALMVDSHGRVAHSNSPARALFARGGHGSARWRAWHADGRPMAAHELPTARAARGERLRGYECEVEDQLAATAATAAEELTGPTVLIVEDQADTRETLRLVLELEGYRVLAADDGLQAIELAAARRPAIALIDIGLPGVDGYEVARRLRAGSDGKSIHLIALTGYGSDEDRRRSLESGFDVHLVKPIEPAELTRLLAGVDKG